MGPIELSCWKTVKPAYQRLMESYIAKDSYDYIKEAMDEYQQVLCEAVFTGGKESLKNIEDQMQIIKDDLENAIVNQNKGSKQFDPKAYWKSINWKNLEDSIMKTFGFRSVSINPTIEKYNSSTKEFQSKEMNCAVWNPNRYNIEGILTEKGFYDKTHSCMMMVYISLGLVKVCTAPELVAILLHEFGHSIDPAICDVSYNETNVLSDYMRGRKEDVFKNKKQQGKKLSKLVSKYGVTAVLMARNMQENKGDIKGLKKLLKQNAKAGNLNAKEEMQKAADISELRNDKDFKNDTTDTKIGIFGGKHGKPDKKIEQMLTQIKLELRNEKDEFNYQNYSEAFADNFARMYGYGVPLISGIKKMSSSIDNYISRINKEKVRQHIILTMTFDCINDEHKTDIHRAKALINEYKKDLNDPKLPEKYKAGIREDMEALEKILDEYQKDFSTLQNRINKVILEELNAKWPGEAPKDTSTKEEKKEEEPKKEETPKAEEKVEPKTESVEDEYTFFESRRAYEKLIKDRERLSPEERGEAKRLFGNVGCSFGKERKGYYCYTHRARSKSYPTIDKIPKSVVNFIDSTC